MKIDDKTREHLLEVASRDTLGEGYGEAIPLLLSVLGTTSNERDAMLTERQAMIAERNALDASLHVACDLARLPDGTTEQRRALLAELAKEPRDDDYTPAELAKLHECFGAALAVLARIKGARMPSRAGAIAGVRERYVIAAQQLSIAQTMIGDLARASTDDWPPRSQDDHTGHVEHELSTVPDHHNAGRFMVMCSCGWWSGDFPSRIEAEGPGRQHVLAARHGR